VPDPAHSGCEAGLSASPARRPAPPRPARWARTAPSAGRPAQHLCTGWPSWAAGAAACALSCTQRRSHAAGRSCLGWPGSCSAGGGRQRGRPSGVADARGGQVARIASRCGAVP
jgi:hypothetical protein